MRIHKWTHTEYQDIEFTFKLHIDPLKYISDYKYDIDLDTLSLLFKGKTAKYRNTRGIHFEIAFLFWSFGFSLYEEVDNE